MYTMFGYESELTTIVITSAGSLAGTHQTAPISSTHVVFHISL